MVWSHYAEEARMAENYEEYDEHDSDDERLIPRNRPLDFHEWTTWYSNDLMNLWMSIKTYREDTGLSGLFLDQMDWNDFCEFCYNFSCKLPSS